MSAQNAASSQNRLVGVIGFFDEPNALIQATSKVRDANYQSFDAFTPFAVHGLDAAQGLKRSPLPFVTFTAGLTGLILAFVFQYWTSAVDWPIIVGGKPFNSWPAWVPIMFELTVLLAGLSTVAAMFIFNGLPNVTRKSFDPSLTRDRFAVVIESPLPIEEDDVAAIKKAARFKKFDEKEAKDFLVGLGAKEVRSVYSERWF